MSFPAFFAWALDEAGSNQTDFARETGILQQEVSEWVRGRRLASAPNRPKVVKWLKRKRVPFDPAQLERMWNKNVDIALRVDSLEARVNDLEETLVDLREIRRSLRALLGEAVP